MKIKLNETIRHGMAGDYKSLPQRYWKNDIIEVVPATNLYKDSDIVFWVNQDGWDDDGEGFPVYKGTYTEILYTPKFLSKWKMPKSDYGGEDMSDFYIVISCTRDSDDFEQSNWDCILADYPESFDEDTNKGILIAEFGHWACGWFKLMMVHETDFELLETMDEVKEKLDDYGLYNDEDYYRREMEAQEELVKDEIEYYIRNNGEEFDDRDFTDAEISQMVYWFVRECNSNDETPKEDEIYELVQRVLNWKTCNICVQYNDAHGNSDGYRQESYDQRFDVCGCHMRLEL